MPLVLVDLDEVIADFTGAALAVHGWTREELEQCREPGSWSIVNPMRLTLTEFWKPIRAKGEEFWMNIELLPWAHDLILLLTDGGYDWHIVTSPDEHVGSYTGKIKWLHKHFGWRLNRCWLNSHKHLLAKPGRILIDDREENIKAFEEHGGDGIIFPSMGNCIHRAAHNPVPHVAKLLEIKHALSV